MSPYLNIYPKYTLKIQISYKSDKNSGYFTWWPMYIYDNIWLDSSKNEKYSRKELQTIKTHILCSSIFFPPENRTVYKIMWKSAVQPCRPQMTTQRMRSACWIPNATNTRSEYVIPIAFPRQHWLHARTSKLRYPCTACLVCFIFINASHQ
jgi:hypothetical protein